MCILRNVSEDKGLVKAVKLFVSDVKYELLFYINGCIYTTFAWRVISGVIQLICNLVVVSCSALHTKISNVTRISFSSEIYLL